MKTFVLLCCLAYTASASLNEDKEEWIKFKNNHGKSYKNVQEENLRFTIFQRNLREIENHNRQYEAGTKTFTKGVNYFADFTNAEFISTLTHKSTGNLIEKTSVYQQPFNAEIPDSLDWRDKGAVSKVKTQGMCGACWAFSVTGTLESFSYLKTNEMVLLSEQQLVDCATENFGCTGGEEGPALEYVKKYGIEPADSYPYDAEDAECHYNESAVYLKIKDFVQIEPYKEDDLLTAVATLGPISVALDATQLPFYRGGVFTSDQCSQDSTNHAVLAVGYGIDNKSGLDYWIIKNSWGEDWGEEGYFRIRRGNNECAIAIDCVYPVL